jgi:glycine/D-amino acid oxidase-like deaminating enzyme
VESVRCEVVINAAGLGAAVLQEGVVPDRERVKLYPVKGQFRRIETGLLIDRELPIIQRSWSIKYIALDLPMSWRRSGSPRYTPCKLAVSGSQ